ncbi:MAG: hypothetical protein AB9903_03275 [Vulcanimicrobiota bacterium]
MNSIGGSLFNREMGGTAPVSPVSLSETASLPGEISGTIENTLNKIEHLKTSDASPDGVTISANIAEHLKDSPLLEKLNGLIASALVVSGVKTMYSGVKEHDRVKFLTGSKQTMWGTYYGLNAIDTVFKTAISLTPGMRAIGGFINADLGLTALYKDFRKEGKLDKDRALLDCGVTAWGLRHLALGAEGLTHTKWIATALSNASPSAAAVLCNTSIMGAIGSAFGIAGGALDVALGARLMAKGVKSNDREKKILGALDMGIGTAMGASCVMTGLPAALTIGAGSLGLVYRTWRTDKDEIIKYLKMTKDTVSEWGRKLGDFLKGSSAQKPAEAGNPDSTSELKADTRTALQKAEVGDLYLR